MASLPSGLMLVTVGPSCPARTRPGADPQVSETVVWDMRARAPSGERRRVSYPVSDSMPCIRRAKELVTTCVSNPQCLDGSSYEPEATKPIPAQ